LTRNKIRYKGKVGQNWTPAAGETVKGATSNATGVVKSLILDTGTVAGDDAAGTIVFTNGSVSGTFQDGEELQESGTATNIAGDAVGANTDDAFTGDNTNYFNTCLWKSVLYLTNNTDVIQKYNGTDLSRLHIDLDVEGGPDNDVTRVKFIILMKHRLVIFDTTERGTTHATRARWCEVNDPDTWKDDNWVDCPIEDEMMGMEFLGDDLIVFFKKAVRKFVYTGDEDLPFSWQLVDGFEGSYAAQSVISLHNELLAVGKGNIVGTDGHRSYTVDMKNPEFIPTWLLASISYSHGRIWNDLEQAWFTYTSDSATANADGNTYPDKVLVLDYIQKNWATYDLPIHVMGLTDLEDDLTWNDVTDAWNDIDWSWNDAGIQSASDIPLMGSQDGKVYRLNNTIADNGSAITGTAESARWNPFVKEGYKARLGYIDFLVDVDSDAYFTVYSYVDSDETSFSDQQVNCTTRDGADDKVWHRVDVNASGRFHKIKIEDGTASSRPRIHCIMPWFDKAGRLV
jgi:hypothetical protein